MRRRTLYAMAAVLLLPVGLLFGAGPAGAQASNEAGSTIGPCGVTVNTVDLGTFKIGDVIKAHLVPVCLFDVGAAVPTVVNGQSVGTKTADATGGINVSITVVSSTQLSIDDPVVVTGQCGANSVSGTGPSSAAQSNVTVTGIFTVLCPAATVVSKSGLAFTGANIALWVAIALALVFLGFVMVRTVRRRRNSEAAA